MSEKNNHYVDPDDFFADTRMTFGEHIEDLRTHLIRALKGFMLAVVVSFFFARPVLGFIQAPVKRQLEAYWERYYLGKQREMQQETHAAHPSPTLYIWIDMASFAEALDLRPKDAPLFNATPAFVKVLEDLGVGYLVDLDTIPQSNFRKVAVKFADLQMLGPEIHRVLKQIQPPSLTTLSVQEAFVVWVMVALATGFVLGAPWIFYQLWLFIAAGLYPHEKKYIHLFLPFSLVLFLGGVALCEFFVMDKAVEALLWFNEYLGMAPDLRLSEWLGFAIFMPLIFGVSFQTPLVMLGVQRIGLVSVDVYRRHRRIIWFLMAVFAAVITPSTDPVSMCLLWIPMVLLFELGIWLCTFLPGRPLLEFDAPEPEEMVEV